MSEQNKSKAFMTNESQMQSRTATLSDEVISLREKLAAKGRALNAAESKRNSAWMSMDINVMFNIFG
jgi:Mg2+ and Co2+ transporter CorA